MCLVVVLISFAYSRMSSNVIPYLYNNQSINILWKLMDWFLYKKELTFNLALFLEIKKLLNSRCFLSILNEIFSSTKFS